MSILIYVCRLTLFMMVCCLWGAIELHAQGFIGGGAAGAGRARTGAGASSAYSSQRVYYPQGMIGEAIIEADRDSRSIIVITDEQTNEHIQEIIKNVDRPVQQVLIKVVFMEVTYRKEFDFGIEGAVNLNSNGTSTFTTNFGLIAQSFGGFYQLLQKDVEVVMKAISEVGKMEVLSRPSILTRNNQEAAILVGQEVPIITSSRITTQGDTINTPQYRELGIILRVTPFITKDGLVEMILSPEISAITEETVQISEQLELPVFSKRSADTVVVTPNGQTVVIGGMMEDNNTDVVRKIPILGDIPLLGLAFRRNMKDNTKRELLIFLTPYVVEGPHRLADMTSMEKSNATMLSKEFQEQPVAGESSRTPVEEPPLDSSQIPPMDGMPSMEGDAANRGHAVNQNEEVKPEEKKASRKPMSSKRIFMNSYIYE